MKTALITGITGQDGSFLAKSLIEKGNKVYGVVRRSSVMNRQRIEDLYYKKYHYDETNFQIFYGDLGDSSSKREPKIKFNKLVELMVKADLYHVKNNLN